MLLLKKKKYAAVTMEKKPTGELVTNIELKGLDIVRRDWSQLASDSGKQILSKVNPLLLKAALLNLKHKPHCMFF
jgi:DNA polymerase alpha subunit A